VTCPSADPRFAIASLDIVVDGSGSLASIHGFACTAHDPLSSTAIEPACDAWVECGAGCVFEVSGEGGDSAPVLTYDYQSGCAWDADAGPELTTQCPYVVGAPAPSPRCDPACAQQCNGNDACIRGCGC
jgi:hypothetical protein